MVITQMSNGWYISDEAEVPRILDAFMLAGYLRVPHWFFVYGRDSIVLQSSQRGVSILAPPDARHLR